MPIHQKFTMLKKCIKGVPIIRMLRGATRSLLSSTLAFKAYLTRLLRTPMVLAAFGLGILWFICQARLGLGNLSPFSLIFQLRT